ADIVLAGKTDPIEQRREGTPPVERERQERHEYEDCRTENEDREPDAAHGSRATCRMHGSPPRNRGQTPISRSKRGLTHCCPTSGSEKGLVHFVGYNGSCNTTY